MSKIPAQIGIFLFAAVAAFGQTASVTGGSSLAFGTTFVNVTTAAQTLTVTADSTTTLDQITSAQLTVPAGFAATIGTCTAGAGNSCAINVTFTPTAVGPASGNLIITATTGAGATAVTVTPSSIALSGTGYEPTVTVQLMGKLVTLNNQLSSPLTFTYALTGGAASPFALTGGTCPASGTGSLASGSCTITIGAASTPSTESDTLTVTAVSGSTSVPVTGSPATIGEPGATSAGSVADTGLEQQVQLTAAPTTVTMPDGTIVPMWGYSCGAAATSSGATCAKLNPNATGWSPVVITVPSGQDLEIELTNSLSFTAGATTNKIPTSIMIVGQVGGGLGSVSSTCNLTGPTTASATGATCTQPPDHSNAQGTYTWVTANLPGNGTPPVQGPRVRSFGTEVAAGTTADLIWKNPRPGTYLLESGTHPSIQVPMGLYGILVVTCAPNAPANTCGAGIANGTAYPAVTGTAPAPSYPAVTYNAEIPLELSEIDPVQNTAVDAAVRTAGFSETAVWSAARTGPLTSTNIVYGGSGYSQLCSTTVTTSCTSATVVGANGSGATVSLTITGGVITGASITAGGSGYSATAPANVMVSDTSATPGSGAIISAVTTPNTSGCGATHTCYPPAVNYTPFYYLINGAAFNKTNSVLSNFAVAPASGVAGTGTVLVRLVNAGVRMHVPSIVGSQTTGFDGAGNSTTVGGFTLVAEDGNVVPNLLPNTNLGQTAGAPKVQTDVFMAAGKIYDLMINAPATGSSALPIYARDLALSGNSSERDAGMLAYISVNGAALPTFGAGVAGSPVVNPDTYNSVVACTAAPCTPVVVSDVSKGVIANDVFVFGVQLAVGPTGGTLTCGATPGNPVPGLCSNGTFTYTPNPGTSSDSFTYCANGTTQTSVPSYCTTVTLGAVGTSLTSTLTMNGISYTAKAAGYINIPTPGPLSVDKDSLGYPLSVVVPTTPSPGTCTSLSLQADGGFIATATTSSCAFTYTATNNHGLTGTATVTINFPAASNLAVRVLDGLAYKACGGDSSCIAGLPNITDYRWVIEEDKTFYVNPACSTITSSSTPIAGCPTFGSAGGPQVPPTFGVNFHTSHMDLVAQGCTSNAPGDQSCEQGQSLLGVLAVCEAGNGVCVPGNAKTPLLPSQVALDPGCGFGTFAGRTCGTGVTVPFPKRYYMSILPGDAGNPFIYGYGNSPQNCVPTTSYSTAPRSTQCGHGMGGAPISWNTTTNSWNSVIVLTEPSPYPPANLSVSVFEDDFPLNGEQDAGGGIDVIATNEPGLGGFEVILFDAFAEPGDVTGQLTHDMFNQPLSNGLAGTIDPATGLDACPVSAEITGNVTGATGYTSSTPVQGGVAGPDQAQGALAGLTGRIVTCPKYESDGATLSPLAGQALVKNMMQGKYIAQAMPGASRIAAGEEWLQTNTLDGQHPHDAFLRIGEPSYFQEYGPAGFHVSIGFANPKIINNRLAAICNGTDLNLSGTNCNNTVTGRVTSVRLSRPPDERLYSSGSRDAFYWSQCWVSMGDPDGEDFAFTKCDANGNFKFTGIPQGNWRITIGDQWNDQIIDGLSTPVNVCTSTTTSCSASGQTIAMGDVAVQQWQANLYTKTCIDDNRNGICDPGEVGIPFLNNAIRYRNGALANNLLTDFTGVANFNETFPLFNWYTTESDTTRYKTTGIHTVYDAGGPANGTTCGGGFPACESGTPYDHLANTIDPYPLPGNLSVPGAIYCATGDCTGQSINTGVAVPSSSSAHTGRIDPPWTPSEGWQGFTGQNNFVEFAKAPYATGENGGIHGHVVYASTRPFDDPQMLVQTQWTPLIPNVTMNLYQEGFAADGVTPILKLVDTTQTSSWDKFAQGFRSDGIPNLNCPGQAPSPTSTTPGDLFFYTLDHQPNWLNLYDYYYNGVALPTIPNNSQYKCYDAMHNWNQLQPAPYDGMYQFPSMLGSVPNSSHNATAYPALVAAAGGVGTGTAFTAASMAGTNCTICVANPDSTDLWRVGTPMLPPGKYVVEVVLPQGYELVKEEDKNILIGDNYIAPVYQQFGGLANIFIMPDQASVASLYDPSGAGYNANNAQNPSQAFGFAPTSDFVPGFLEPVWPCVGQLRQVPDYMSLFPEAHQVAAFAGSMRHLCDRKEVTLNSQMSASAKFWLYTSTHIASPFAGVITDDFTSEFDPFAPVFGEKFSPPNMPISTRDWAGNEISRVYSDQWGAFNGLVYSTWEVNPPNPTGYGPNTMVQCMNDKGPAIDFRQTIVNSSGATVANPNYGQLVGTDPLYNPLYSQFCYELPYLPGMPGYLDTPVVPTAAFVGAGYNNTDCNYPTNTPAVSEVDGDGVGPWILTTGTSHAITITALGDQIVNNYGYSGPQATGAPFNQKAVTRHYGFGATQGTVKIGGYTVPTGNVTWGDLSIRLTIPANATGAAANQINACPIQQQAQYTPVGTATAYCGELTIISATGQQSVDTVNITIGGKAPVHVNASGSIQQAIDAAMPGDLIMVDPSCSHGNGNNPNLIACSSPGNITKNPSTHRELLIMWKPVRLQGVGAASSIIDGSTFPAGQFKLEPWRRSVNCLFGLALNGQPIGSTIPNGGGTNVYDPSGKYNCPTPGANGQTGPDGYTWNYFSGGPNFPTMVVDRIPLEGILGWDATVNGNLAEQLQEPSLMGAYEGAGITVLSKGVNIPAGSTDVFGSGAEATFPAGSTLLTGPVGPNGGALLGDLNPNCHTLVLVGPNPYPSNFICNPSTIDGMGITDASQGGGGIFVHAWAHNLQIANNRVFNNAGTLSGGLSLGQGEFPEAYLNPDASSPSTCLNALSSALLPANTQLPYCENINLNVHNNMVTNNSSTGDELFTGTPAGAGGVSICTGDDWYKFNYNWVCGNISTGDAGGVGHLGFSWNGDIEHNSFLFNQATNPSIVANGGGLMIMGAAPDATITVNGVATECGSVTDNDCVPGLSDGVGPGLVINANLIQGNAADSGSGGGLRLQGVNGAEVARFPTQPNLWYHVQVQNNMIVNNVAGWDGAGISLEDALAVRLINNTIASNDTTASSGVLVNTIGAPLASSQSPPSTCALTTANGGTASATASCPQPAGLVSQQNSPQLTSSFVAGTLVCPGGAATCPVVCPPGNYAPSTSASNGTCIAVSYPELYNNMIWQNRSFQVGVGSAGTGQQNQQNVVTLYNAAFPPSTTPVLPGNQASTGACPSGSSYWDIGVRGDTGPGNHSSGTTLNPLHGVLTSTTGYSSTNLSSNPAVVSQFCNGSRTPPEATCLSASGQTVPCGWQVPPGIADAQVPNPIFTLAPAATVDEGNNWINISWGPLSILNPVSSSGTTNVALGNYSLQPSSPDINAITCSSTAGGVCTETLPAGSAGVASIQVPNSDFFGNPRPDTGNPNHVDIGAVEVTPPSGAFLTVTPASLAFGNQAVGFASPAQTLTLSNTGTAGATGIAVIVTAPFSRTGTGGTNCGTTLGAGATCTINIVFTPTATGLVNGTATITASVPVNNEPVALSGNGIAAVLTASVTPSPLAFGSVVTGTTASGTLTVTNTGNVAFTGVTVTGFAAPFSRPGGAGGGTCTATLAMPVGGTCTIIASFAPTATGSFTDNITVASTGITVSPTPVVLTGTGAPAVRTATVTPSPLAFGNQATGVASFPRTLTVTNTGNVALTGGGFTFGGGAPQPFTRPGGAAGGTCAGTLALGASCTINVVFTPPTATAFSRTLTVAYTGATVTGSPVTLTGTGQTPPVPSPLSRRPAAR